jgi:hypothetical protein
MHCRISQSERVNSIKETLVIISWRFNEIDKKYKYNHKQGKLFVLEVFSERNWIVLDYLAEALNFCNHQDNSNSVESFFNSIGIALDKDGDLDKEGELGKLRRCLPDIQKVILGETLKDDCELFSLTRDASDKEKMIPFLLENMNAFVSFF